MPLAGNFYVMQVIKSSKLKKVQFNAFWTRRNVLDSRSSPRILEVINNPASLCPEERVGPCEAAAAVGWGGANR